MIWDDVEQLPDATNRKHLSYSTEPPLHYEDLEKGQTAQHRGKTQACY